MPNSAITRVSGLDIVPSPTNINNGFYVPQLTQAQIDAIPEDTLKRGGIVYNTTTGFLQTYDQNDAWVNVELAGAVAGDVVVASHTTAGEPAAQNGLIYYNTDLNKYKATVNGAYQIFYASTSGEIVVVNHDNAGQPAAANGLIYYNTTNNQYYATLSNAYKALYATSDLTGVLVATIVANTGALPVAPTNGMIVYQTDIGSLKVYNGAWLTLYEAPVTATGTGLTGKPFQFPTGAAVDVEVAGNQVAGFTYLNTTASKLKFWTGAAWETITSA